MCLEFKENKYQGRVLVKCAFLSLEVVITLCPEKYRGSDIQNDFEAACIEIKLPTSPPDMSSLLTSAQLSF